MEEHNVKIKDNDYNTTYKRVGSDEVTLEEDLINKWLYSMVRGEHVFLTEPSEEGARHTAIKIEDLIAKFKEFKKLWDVRDES